MRADHHYETGSCYIEANFDGLKSLIDREKEYLFLIDRNVDVLYGEFFQGRKIIIDAREELKSLETVNSIIEEMIAAQMTRDTLLIGVGGGITTDIAGFVASIYKRGIRVAFVPTTLIAQTDASIGGKNGVNSVSYKNMIGCFREPEWIYANMEVLKSLSHEDYLCGVAEVLKTFIIGDRAKYFETVELLKSNNPYITEDVLKEVIEIKKAIVQNDPFEGGERRVLNLGHTFGHAIELLEGVPHGIAVAKGIVIASKISHRMGQLSKEEMERIETDFRDIGLIDDRDIISCMSEDLIGAIAQDKKRSEDFINFVTVKEIGSVRVTTVNIKELEYVTKDLCKHSG